MANKLGIIINNIKMLFFEYKIHLEEIVFES